MSVGTRSPARSGQAILCAKAALQPPTPSECLCSVEGRPWIPRRSSLDPPGLGVFSGSPGTKRSSLDPRLFVVQSRPSLDPVSEKASSLDPRTKNGPLWLPNFKTVHQALAARTDIQTDKGQGGPRLLTRLLGSPTTALAGMVGTCGWWSRRLAAGGGGQCLPFKPTALPQRRWRLERHRTLARRL